MATRSKQPKATSATYAPAHDQGESVGGIIEHIDGEAGDDGGEMMVLDAGSPQPARATRQSPATRSTVNIHRRMQLLAGGQSEHVGDLSRSFHLDTASALGRVDRDGADQRAPT
ncbi:hypothetical protein HH800_01895 [Sphingobium yanoikuyae]|uniref:Uncharacterized protein n=1 Tax=Sphingobium yanoikuyae TaxID=13690 RepID=A0A6M4G5T6_SPHYA|nr:hypothetical protein [Sphingobium yanoikuyae]QJR01057.1 hypothetical protein HH800_01895 [Sphingobium yanoikuyae]